LLSMSPARRLRVGFVLVPPAVMVAEPSASR